MFGVWIGCVVAGMLLAGNAYAADVVELTGGDRLLGKILSMSESTLTLQTDYAGELSIDRTFIRSIRAESELVVELEDGAQATETVRLGAPVQDEADDDAAAGPWRDLAEIAELRPVLPYYRYKGNLAAGLDVVTGNTRTRAYHLSGLLEPSFGKNTVTLSGQWNRQRADGELTASNWRLGAEYKRDLTDRIFVALFNGYQNDRLQELDLRITASAGAGYRFFIPSPTLLTLEGGIAYVDEDYRTDDDREFAAFRAKTDFAHDIWADRLKAYHQNQLTVGLTENQYIALTRTGLELQIMADLSLAAEYQFDWNDSPATGAKKTDHRYFLKLGFAFRGDETDWWQ